MPRRQITKPKSTKASQVEVLRPRTAYNFFYRFQRDLILKSRSNPVTAQQGKQQHFAFFNEPLKQKRPHRKTHGLIGFQQLTKTVAKRWNEAGPEIRNKFYALAEQDKIRYSNEQDAAQRAKASNGKLVDCDLPKRETSCLIETKKNVAPLLQVRQIDNTLLFAANPPPLQQNPLMSQSKILSDPGIRNDTINEKISVVTRTPVVSSNKDKACNASTIPECLRSHAEKKITILSKTF